MASRISRRFNEYQRAIEEARADYDQTLQTQLAATPAFLDFFHPHMVRLGDYRLDPGKLERIQTTLRNYLGLHDNNIAFAAIDGDSFREQQADFLVFGSAAYAVFGTLDLGQARFGTSYERWDPRREESVVNYLPVPLSKLQERDHDPYTAYTDEERADYSFIHRQLMQLAEVRLALSILESKDCPNVIIVDYSLGGAMVSNSQKTEDVDMRGRICRGHILRYQDVAIAHSHPHSEGLGVPHYQRHRLDEWVYAQICKQGPLTFGDLFASTPYGQGGKEKEWERFVDKVLSMVKEGSDGSPLFRPEGGHLPVLRYDQGACDSDNRPLPSCIVEINPEYRDSWSRTRELFNDTCKRLFDDKHPNALEYSKEKHSDEIFTMTPNDLKFLISIGLRLMIEKAWEQNVLLLGIARDSASRYLTRNFLGVMRDQGILPEDPPVVALPATDRHVLEAFAYKDATLEAPWASSEFDGCFMTVARRALDPHDPSVQIRGVRGNVVSPQPGLFARCIGQFFLERHEDGTVKFAGKAISVDRLCNPRHDGLTQRQQRPGISADELGHIHPIYWMPEQGPNRLQEATLAILYHLTRNYYPQVIGLPDPLHRAEWGARSIMGKIQPLVRSSARILGRSSYTSILKRQETQHDQ